jgi:anti-sigma B factor antagonist
MEWQLAGVGADGYELVRVKGDCDLYNAPPFTAAMIDKIAKGCARMKIDFSGVSYLDSTGVGSLIKIIKRAKAAKSELCFSGISGSPRRVLVMSNIISLIHEDERGGAVK